MEFHTYTHLFLSTHTHTYIQHQDLAGSSLENYCLAGRKARGLHAHGPNDTRLSLATCHVLAHAFSTCAACFRWLRLCFRSCATNLEAKFMGARK